MDTLQLQIPDFATFDSAAGVEKPFALWDVVDQPLLFHWFDHAVDQELVEVTVHCPGHLQGPIQRAVESATLWPIDVRLAGLDRETPASLSVVNRLPHQEPEAVPSLKTFEELLGWHAALSVERLEHIWNVLRVDFPFLVQGHGSRVHPDAVLEGPYWIGDGAEIEAGASIGAYSVIGHGAWVRRGAMVRDTQLAAGAVVSSKIRLDGHTVAPGLIFNHRRHLLHPRVDPRIVRFRRVPSIT